jgi:hypothetical protein
MGACHQHGRRQCFRSRRSWRSAARRFLKLGMMMMLGLRRKVCEMAAGAAAAALNKCDSLLYLNRQCTDNRLSYVCTQCVLLLSPAADQKAIQRYTAVSGRRNVTTCVVSKKVPDS